jgi:predicted membrane protein
MEVVIVELSWLLILMVDFYLFLFNSVKYSNNVIFIVKKFILLRTLLSGDGFYDAANSEL